MGQGGQPQPSKLRLAHQVNALPGEPQVIFRPSEKRAAHGPGDAAGAKPRPQHAEGGRATWAVSGVQPEQAGDANSGNNGKHCAGCPPVVTAVQWQRAGGAVLGGDEGVQPERQRVALATAELPCSVDLRLKRLLLPSLS